MLQKSIKLKADAYLVKCKITKFPITDDDLLTIMEREGWIVQDYAAAADFIDAFHLRNWVEQFQAFTFEKDKNYYILYDPKLSYNERLFAFGHEIGHIILGHTSSGGILGQSDDKALKNSQEVEADEFAYEFFAPLCVLRKCGIKTYDDFISLGLMGGKYAEHMFIELTQSMTSLSQEENSLCKQTKDFIHQVKIKAFFHKYRFLLIGTCVAIITICCAYSLGLSRYDTRPSHQPDFAVHQAQETNTVVVTRTGEKYHRPYCGYVQGKKGMRELPIAEAKKENFEPCSMCNP